MKDVSGIIEYSYSLTAAPQALQYTQIALSR
jgi:hypothetical protein